MSIHIGTEKGMIADTVLLPGDPLRAQYVAENFLKDAVCYNQVRGMLGFTGTYNGKKISVQGSGMGIPSLSIYTEELIRFYDVTTLIRIGSCGGLQEDLGMKDIIIAMSGSTESAVNNYTFQGRSFAPTADSQLFIQTVKLAEQLGIPYRAGNIVSNDIFYQKDPQWWKIWADHGVLAVEMETSGLYTIAASHGVRALSICSVSDNLITGEELSSEERQTSFTRMMKLALETAVL